MRKGNLAFAVWFLVFSVSTLLPTTALPETESFAVKISVVRQEPIWVKDFSAGPSGTQQTFFLSRWKGSSVKLNFADLQKITFLHDSATAQHNARVFFRDGRKDSFLIFDTWISGKTAFGPWEFVTRKAREIEFFSPGDAARQSPEGGAREDRVVLRKGEVVAGELKTPVFTLQTPSGTLRLETAQIRRVSLEDGGGNRDVVFLRIGDKISGVIQETEIIVKSNNGKELNLPKEAIREIQFNE
jgi:hypothetical protein